MGFGREGSSSEENRGVSLQESACQWSGQLNFCGRWVQEHQRVHFQLTFQIHKPHAPVRNANIQLGRKIFISRSSSKQNFASPEQVLFCLL